MLVADCADRGEVDAMPGWAKVASVAVGLEAA